MPRSRLTIGIRAVVLITLVALTSASAAYGLLAGRNGDPVAPPTKQQTGKQLYRKYCGQCHALVQALAAGFGSNNGLGQDGGPSFDTLRVPFNLSVVAVTTPWAGHEVVNSKMTWTEVKQVANYVQIVTKDHRGLAQPIDG